MSQLFSPHLPRSLYAHGFDQSVSAKLVISQNNQTSPSCLLLVLCDTVLLIASDFVLLRSGKEKNAEGASGVDQYGVTISKESVGVVECNSPEN